jgi:hypothetical protein
MSKYETRVLTFPQVALPGLKFSLVTCVSTTPFSNLMTP